MDVREKLIEILENSFEKQYEKRCLLTAPHTVEDLIAHGVTVQEWISFDDKYPPYNRDVLVYRPNMAMKIVVDTYDGYYGDDDDEWYEGWALYGKDTHGNPAITHWSYLPKPPKGE